MEQLPIQPKKQKNKKSSGGGGGGNREGGWVWTKFGKWGGGVDSIVEGE